MAIKLSPYSSRPEDAGQAKPPLTSHVRELAAEPRISVGQITVAFHKGLLASKSISSQPGVSLRYYGPVAFIHFRKAAFDQTENLEVQVRQRVMDLCRLGLLIPSIETLSRCDFRRIFRIHNLVFHCDFSAKTFFTFQNQRFKFSTKYRRAYSDEHTIQYRTRVRHGREFREVKSVIHSFVSGSNLTSDGGEGQRLTFFLGGPLRKYLCWDQISGPVDFAFRSVAALISLRLSQVCDPQNLQLNYALVCLLRAEFVEILRRAGWFSAETHIARRAGKRIKAGGHYYENTHLSKDQTTSGGTGNDRT